MKKYLLRLIHLGLIASSTSALAAESSTPVGQTDAVTNIIQATPITAAQFQTRRQAPPATARTALTNSALRAKPSTLRREIKSIKGGAEATFGGHKVFFNADAAEPQPVTIVAPDARKLAFRATFLALYNRGNKESLLLAEITNRVGKIVLPETILYTNAFDSLRADLRYHYDAKSGSLEQDVILRQRPSIPKEWNLEDVQIEVWTEWFDAEPIGIESQDVILREDFAGLGRVQMADETVKFGAMKIVAGGKAFSAGDENDRVNVAKSWATHVEGSRTFLVETIDYIAVKSKLESLPLTARFDSPNKINLGRR